MGTTNVTLTELGTVQAHPSGTLGWAHIKCDIALNDEFIESDEILKKWGGSGNASGVIIQVCDGGGDALVLSGAATGLSLCTNIDVASGDITFRSYNDGKAGDPAIKAKAATNLEFVVMIRF